MQEKGNCKAFCGTRKRNYEKEIYDRVFVLEHDKKKPRAQWTIGVFYLEIIKLEVLLCDI